MKARTPANGIHVQHLLLAKLASFMALLFYGGAAFAFERATSKVHQIVIFITDNIGPALILLALAIIALGFIFGRKLWEQLLYLIIGATFLLNLEALYIWIAS